MNLEAINRAARQIALPEIGLDGQVRISSATVVIAGDDLGSEVVARTLSAAGVERLRLIRRTGPLSPEMVSSLRDSNPLVQLDTRTWPARPGSAAAAAGEAWLAVLAGATVIVRAGFDDDALLRAAVRLAIPVVVLRGREDGTIDVVSFRRHGPCPHAPLDVPEQPALPSEDGAAVVVAAHVAAAEALVLIAGATRGSARARHVSIRGTGTGTGTGDDAGGDAGAERSAPIVRAVDIPWSPECFACGGSGAEMSFT